MANKKKQGVLAYVLEDMPTINRLHKASASADPIQAIEPILAELREDDASSIRKKLGPTLEGRGLLDQHGTYLNACDVRLRDGRKAVVAVMPCEVDA